MLQRVKLNVTCSIIFGYILIFCATLSDKKIDTMYLAMFETMFYNLTVKFPIVVHIFCTQCVQKVHIVATSHTQITQQEINEALDFIPLILKYFNFVWFLLRQTAWDKNLVFQMLNHKGINIKIRSFFQLSFPMRHYSIAHSVHRKNYTQKLKRLARGVIL